MQQAGARRASYFRALILRWQVLATLIGAVKLAEET